ncbi:MAG TPA: hypothetical protein VFC84_19465 [Desulfosporosinus sp.]|nr:hypothetical protein [Desulfosporosinus sp.]
MSQPDSFEKRVKEAIERTGLPTEIRATKTLVDNGWQVQNEFPFIDLENQKVRTLDIKAINTFRKGNPENSSEIFPKNEIDCELFIECKKSENPWVFYLDTLTNRDLLYRMDRLADDVVSDTFNTILDAYAKDIKSTELEKSKIHRSILTKIPAKISSLNYQTALSHQILFIKQANDEKLSIKGNNDKTKVKVEEDRDEIYSAEMQIFKALSYQDTTDKSVVEYKRAIIPIILLNGSMFGCYYENQELKTPKIEYTRHLAHGLPHQQVPALLDIVTLDFFPQYIKLINKEFQTKCSQLAS